MPLKSEYLRASGGWCRALTVGMRDIAHCGPMSPGASLAFTAWIHFPRVQKQWRTGPIVDDRAEKPPTKS